MVSLKMEIHYLEAQGSGACCCVASLLQLEFHSAVSSVRISSV